MKKLFCLTLLIAFILSMGIKAAAPAQAGMEQAASHATQQDGWPQTLTFTVEGDQQAAYDKLETGSLDVYAGFTSDPNFTAQIEASPNLEGYRMYGSYTELTFNPAGPVFAGTGKLNPFAVRRVREAVNYLIDREHIVSQIYSGMAVPRWLPINSASMDYARLAGPSRTLELEYGYNPAKAQQILSQEMAALGAYRAGNLWYYNGLPVELIFLIRLEDERLQMGDYIADQLESAGFTVSRQYKWSGEASEIWLNSDPNDGLFHLYTGGWISTTIVRDLASNFAFFYTDRGLDSPLWDNYVPTPEFYNLAVRLEENDFSSMEERSGLMAQALKLAMQDSMRVWLVDRLSVSPRRTEVSYASDLYGGLSGSDLWPYTLRKSGPAGENIQIAAPWGFDQPWNPLDGVSNYYDRGAMRPISEPAALLDPFTGLRIPHRFASAELYVVEGLPVTSSSSWVDLHFVPEITVPDNAWVDWDPVEQRFITAAEAYDTPMTALRKSVVIYPSDLYTTVTWHDGSPFSAADVVMNMIVTFDRVKEESAVYDPSKQNAFYASMWGFRGMRILSLDPLVIEHYADDLQLDAENNINTWWPHYGQNQGAWHNLAIGLMAEAAGQAAFSWNKADSLDIEWLDYLSGPSLGILAAKLNQAQSAGAVPYPNTLAQFISSAEVTARWNNLVSWYLEHNHFMIGTGPFMLDAVAFEPRTMTFERYSAYPDALDRWAYYGTAPLPEVSVTGPGEVVRGTAAQFEVEISLGEQAYPPEDIEQVQFLAIDLLGKKAYTGEAVHVSEGDWQITLDAALTALLPAGQTRLEVVVISPRVAMARFGSHVYTMILEALLTPTGGGSLSYEDTQGMITTVQVPPSAVTENTTLAYVPLAAVTPPQNFAYAGLAFDLNALVGGVLQKGFVFEKPVTLTVDYTDEQIAGLNENALMLYYWDEAKQSWKDAAETCSPASTYTRQPSENRLSVQICHLSRFALFQPNYPLYLPVVRR
jgi:peptide/nickel transport system substrate-binding protein